MDTNLAGIMVHTARKDYPFYPPTSSYPRVLKFVRRWSTEWRSDEMYRIFPHGKFRPTFVVRCRVLMDWRIVREQGRFARVWFFFRIMNVSVGNYFENDFEDFVWIITKDFMFVVERDHCSCWSLLKLLKGCPWLLRDVN